MPEINTCPGGESSWGIRTNQSDGSGQFIPIGPEELAEAARRKRRPTVGVIPPEEIPCFHLMELMKLELNRE